MPNNRMLAVLTALILTGGAPPASGAASLEQLLQIERLVLSNDCGALYSYLTANPSVLTGDDALSTEFRNFVSRVDRGLISCLGASDDLEQPSLADRLAGQY